MNNTHKLIVEVNETGQIVSKPVPYNEQATPPHSIAGGVSTIAILIFLIALIAMSVMKTKQQTVRVIERFGKFSRIAPAGLRFKIPLIESVAGIVDLRTQQLVIDADTKTKDNVFAKVKVAIQYFVLSEKTFDAFYKLEKPKEQITAYVLDTIRAKVPSLDLTEVFEKKEEIASAVKTELTSAMEEYGYKITTALVVDIDPDEKVKAAMNEVQAQTRLKEAKTQQAEGDKIIAVKKAEAEAEAKALQGQGIAKQRKNIIEGLAETTKEMAKNVGIPSSEVMSLILLTQYFDTIKDAGASKVILFPHSPAGMIDIKDQITQALVTGAEVSKN